MQKAIKNAVFHAKETPDALAKIIYGLCQAPAVIASDITVSIEDVANGTALSAIKATLPATVAVPNDLGLPVNASVTWGADTTPTFAPAVAGEYVLTGTLSGLPSFLSNSGTKHAKVTITVLEA